MKKFFALVLSLALILSLSPNAFADVPMIHYIYIDDIPDYKDIDFDYRDAIQKAYQLGLSTGVDSAGTFNPKAILTRAEGATMFVRAGYTSVPEDINARLKMMDVNEASDLGLSEEWAKAVGFTNGENAVITVTG